MKFGLKFDDPYPKKIWHPENVKISGDFRHLCDYHEYLQNKTDVKWKMTLQAVITALHMYLTCEMSGLQIAEYRTGLSSIQRSCTNDAF